MTRLATRLTTRKIKMLRTPMIGAALAASLALPAMAQSSDFSTWSTLGDVLTTAGATSSASLSTGHADDGDALFGGSAVLFDALEPALGIYLAGDTYEGSAVSTSFTSSTAQRVQLSWTLDTAAYDAAFIDRAYWFVDGTAVALADVAASATSGQWQHEFSAGSHTFGFVVMDVNDVAGVSTLSLSKLSVSAVPEPDTYALLLAGLGVLGATARRRSAQR